MRLIPMTSTERLRRDLNAYSVADSAVLAAEHGIRAAVELYPDSEPDKQLKVAREIALREFAALTGWGERR